MRFLRTAPAVRFFYGSESMSSAFVCGNINEINKHYLHTTKTRKVIADYIKENHIDTIYLCKRNDFDYSIFVATIMEYLQVHFITLVDGHKTEYEYRTRLTEGVHFEELSPFEEEIDNQLLFQTLYRYAMEHCEYMITCVQYDDDLSALMMKQAMEQGVSVLNLAD